MRIGHQPFLFCYPLSENVLDMNKNGMSVTQISELLESDDSFYLIDARKESDFKDGFVPGAVFIGHQGHFVEWALNLTGIDKRIGLITPPGMEQICVEALERAGFNNVMGFLEGGFEKWKSAGKPIDMIIEIDSGELALDIRFDKNLVVVDVRLPAEYAQGYVEGAVNIPLIEFADPLNIARFEERDNIYLYSGKGYRGVIAASLLKRQGFNNLHHISGGWETIRHTKGISILKEPRALN